MTALLQRLFNLRREEVAPVLWAVLYFFCILTALMVLRPARDALGMQRGIEAVRWLFMGTALVTLLANPVFGWLVSRYRRMQFIAATMPPSRSSCWRFTCCWCWRRRRSGSAAARCSMCGSACSTCSRRCCSGR
ncbi:MAG: hypothetical protein M3485_01485 [Pseudomonadota bacterium]|nr:hypothetical protein [Pseudomonadota bacterium]